MASGLEISAPITPSWNVLLSTSLPSPPSLLLFLLSEKEWRDSVKHDVWM